MLMKLHHAAYRCRDAQETVDFYTKALGLKFAKGIVQEKVPSLRTLEPHIHIFFELEDGSFVAFFDIASDDTVIADEDLDWAQHLALEIRPENVNAFIERLDKNNVDYIGPVSHGICDSYYFYDPNGLRVEAAVRTDSPEVWQRSADEADSVLSEWNCTKADYIGLKS